MKRKCQRFVIFSGSFRKTVHCGVESDAEPETESEVRYGSRGRYRVRPDSYISFRRKGSETLSLRFDRQLKDVAAALTFGEVDGVPCSPSPTHTHTQTLTQSQSRTPRTREREAETGERSTHTPGRRPRLRERTPVQRGDPGRRGVLLLSRYRRRRHGVGVAATRRIRVAESRPALQELRSRGSLHSGLCSPSRKRFRRRQHGNRSCV